MASPGEDYIYVTHIHRYQDPVNNDEEYWARKGDDGNFYRSDGSLVDDVEYVYVAETREPVPNPGHGFGTSSDSHDPARPPPVAGEDPGRDHIKRNYDAGDQVQYRPWALLRWVDQVSLVSDEWVPKMRAAAESISTESGLFSQGYDVDDLLSNIRETYVTNAGLIADGYYELLEGVRYVASTYERSNEASEEMVDDLTRVVGGAANYFGQQGELILPGIQDGS